MDEELIGSTVLSRGINFQEALNSSTEFHIDVNFKLKKNKNDLLLLDSQEGDGFADDNDDDESDTDVEQVLKNIERSTDQHLLATLAYSSFDQLATRMTDCVTSGKVKMLIIEEDNHSEKELLYFLCHKLKENGKKALAKAVKEMVETNEVKKKNSVEDDKALALCTALSLSKWQYLILRSFLKKECECVLPSYHNILSARKRCYPAEDLIEITEKGASVRLQALLDHTSHRIKQSLNNIGEEELKLIWKWGLDGSSSQSNYKQKFSEPEFDDSSVVMTSAVPLRLITHAGAIVWENPCPGSTSYCRPIKFHFQKETADIIKEINSDIKDQIERLVPSQIGGNGPLIPYDAYVTFHYSAYWENEKIPFDSTFTSRNGMPITKRLGYDSFLLGLQIGLPFVHGPTATVHFLLHPDYMWKNGYFPGIRKERALYSITVVKVKDLAAVERFNELPSAEQKKFETTVKVVDSSNLHAKDLFKKKLYKKAASHYHKSLSVLQVSCPETEEEKEEVLNLICKVYVNLATVYYKLNMPKKIILMCDDLCKVSDINKNCKALYYYGKAFYLLADYDQAKKYYLKALALEPKNSDIGKAMAELEGAINKGKNQERELWRNAFKNKKNEKVHLDVDEEFQNNFTLTCQDLNSKHGFAKFALPDGLNRNEVEYIRDLVKGFDKLTFNEDDVGKSKKYFIIKKMN